MNRTGNIRVTGYLSDGVYFGGGSAATLRFWDIGTPDDHARAEEELT